MAHKPCITAGFVTVCCSMSMVSKTLCSQAVSCSPDIDDHTCRQIAAISPVKEATTAIHTVGLNFTLKFWAESRVLMNVDDAWPFPEANSSTVRSLHHSWAACPCLSWSAIAMPHGVLILSHLCIALAVTLQKTGWARDYSRTSFSLYEIFIHLKFMV